MVTPIVLSRVTKFKAWFIANENLKFAKNITPNSKKEKNEKWSEYFLKDWPSFIHCQFYVKSFCKYLERLFKISHGNLIHQVIEHFWTAIYSKEEFWLLQKDLQSFIAPWFLLEFYMHENKNSHKIFPCFRTVFWQYASLMNFPKNY